MRRHPFRTGPPRRAALAAAAAVALMAGGVLVPGAVATAEPAPPTSPDVVTIDSGGVRGTVAADHRSFRGIPFAAPTSGANRWAPPKPVSPWTGVRDATGPGPACAQQQSGSTEDCLTVDVHTPPAAAGRKLPVMVWFYGGAYQLGAASGYHAAPLVRSGQVIVVGVNYRVGPLGFLSLPELAAGAGGATNYGLLDQQAGLRWVRRNIAAFGGDPRNVTIFGESAGGNSVCQQLMSPRAAGLFDKAIIMSGACTGPSLAPKSRTEIQAASRAYARSMGCADPATVVACLRALPVSALLDSPMVGFSSMRLTWTPSVDGVVVPGTPDRLIRSGRFARVPLMVGGNRDEGRLFVLLQHQLPAMGPVTPAAYETFLRDTFGDRAPEVLAEYPTAAYPSPDVALATVIGDYYFTCAVPGTAAAISARQTRPVYAYEFTETDNPSTYRSPWMPMDASHGVELSYLFNTPPENLTPAQGRLATRMVTAWTTFARTGDPNAAGTTSWPRFRPGGTGRLLELDDAATPATIPVADYEKRHHCGFWSRVTAT